MSLVYWDTMLFVYWLEDNQAYAPRVQAVFDRLAKRGDTLCTSVFSVGEILVGPYKQQQPELAAKIKAYFQSPRVQLLPFTADTAQRYAQIRAAQRVSPAPPAAFLATTALGSGRNPLP